MGDNSLKPLDEKLFQHALSQVSGALQIGDDQIILEPISHKHLLFACQLVWKELGIDFAPVDSHEWKEISFAEQIVEIAEKAAVRIRQVKLEPKWWKSDGMAMLCFYGEEGRPVALLCRSNEYWMIDPKSGNRERVTSELAQEIKQTAYSFLPTVSLKDFSLWSMAKGIFRGSMRDLIKLISYFFIAAFIGLATPVVNQVFFDVVIPGLDISLFAQLLTGLFLISCATLVLNYVGSMLYLRIEGKTSHRMQGLIWDHLLKLAPPFFRRFSAGDLIQRLSIVSAIRDLVGQNSLSIVISGFMSLVYLVPMFWYSGMITLLIMAMTGSLGILVLILSPRLYKLNLNILRLDSWMNTTLIHFFSNIGELRNFRAEKRAFAAWGEKFRLLKEKELQLENTSVVISAMFESASSLSMFLFFIGFFVFYVQGDTSTMSIGQFMGFQTALSAFAGSFYSALESLIANITLIAEWQRVKDIWVGVDEKPKMGTVRAKILGNVDVEHVTFNYENSPFPILKDFNASFKAGEFCVVTGASGSGKSTLLRLISNLEAPLTGVVRFEGISISEYERGSFKAQVASILQSSQVFSGSIIENITCGRKLDESKLKKALVLSTFEEVLPALPMGLNTLLTTGGKLLSSGEQQRLLLARALYSDPAVLILDEATSAIDMETQKRLFKALKGKTLIIATHEEQLFQMADRRIALLTDYK